MSSDSEIDELHKFEQSREKELLAKAGIKHNTHTYEEPSDEEVLGIGSSDSSSEDNEDGQEAYYDQDDATIGRRRAKTFQEQDDNWGEERSNYFGGEDDIGVDEGASDEEEEEALRLREKELNEMAESDFVDEDNLEGWKDTVDKVDMDDQTESLTVDPSSLTAEERRDLIEEKFPVILLLTEELKKFGEWEKTLASEYKESAELMDIGKEALRTYKGMIYSFFALFADRIQNSDLAALYKLEEHPINEGLLMARQMWYTFLDSNWTHKSASLSENRAEQASVADTPSESEAESISEDFDHSSKGEEEEDIESSHEEMSDDEFSIAKPQLRSKPTKRNTGIVGDYDEAADTIEQQARMKNKQSLRFYTSQIGKGAPKSREAYSGDIDLPYRERDFERRQRLMAEAQKRGRLEKDRLGDEDYENEGISQDGEDAASAQAYLELKNNREQQKNEKLLRHAEAVEASRAGKIAEYLANNPNADKRAINYQIEKNKGLTRKRKKENRNARVKKRLRYEAAQKKLKGVRRVYKEPEGPYRGELTGIRKNLTHSTRFKN